MSRPQQQDAEEHKDLPMTVVEWIMQQKMEGTANEYDGVFDDDVDTLMSLSEAARDTADKITALEKTKEELSELIKPLAKKLNTPRRLLSETWELRRTTGSKSTISAAELIARGVPKQIIEDATETKTWESYAVYAVKAPKAQTEKGDT